MAFAETQKLVVELDLSGSLSTGLQKATRSIQGLESVAGRTQRSIGKFGGAISTAGGHLKELITGPLGIIGLGGGLFALGGIFESSIHHASDMGLAVEKLTGLTGESATAMSGLVAVFERFGLGADRAAQIVGFTEKALGKLTATGDKAAAFQKRYGVAITDATGKALPFTVVLNHLADYYNSNAAASDKAAAASTLLGRGYAQMIPILKLGSKGIRDAEEAAAALGLTLTAQNATDLKEYRGALRDVGEAIGGLQLQIGLVLLPEVAKLARGFTDFLAHGGTQQIVGFFKGAAHFAQDLGSVIAKDVIPTISGLAGVAKGFWDSIPAPLRDLLFNTVIADRTIKFLFGVSPIKTVVSFASDAISSGISKGLGTALAGTVLSKVFVQPVFVTNPGFGMGGGLPGAAVGAGEVAVGGAEALGASAGVLGIGALAALAAPFAALVGAAVLADIARNGQVTPIGSPHGQMSAKGGQPGTSPKSADDQFVAPSADTHSENVRIAKAITDGFNTADTRSEAVHTAEANVAATKALAPKLDALHTAFVRDFAGLRHATKPLDIAAFARKVGAEITKGVGSLKTTDRVLASLKAQLARTHDPKLEAVLHAAISKVERRLPGRESAAKANSTLAKMLSDGKLSKAELSRIKTVEQALKDRGLPHAAAVISAKVDAAKRAQVAAANKTTAAAFQTEQAIHNKDLSVTVPVSVSIRDIAGATTVYSRYSTHALR